MFYAPQQITPFVPVSRIGEGIACGHEVAERLIEVGESVDLSDDRHTTSFYIDVSGGYARSPRKYQSTLIFFGKKIEDQT